MPKINIINRNGSSSDAEIIEGQSLMEALRNLGCDEIIAICGGNCSCATCHVYLRNIDMNALPKISEDEEILLGGLEWTSSDSRLSCQLPVSEMLDGAIIVIPPEE